MLPFLSMDDLGEMLTTEEVAVRLRVTAWTVKAWRRAGKGPAFLKIGGRIYYDPAALRQYMAAGEDFERSAG